MNYSIVISYEMFHQCSVIDGKTLKYQLANLSLDRQDK